jgi:hypothetical protein
LSTVAILAQGTTSGQCVSQGLFVFDVPYPLCFSPAVILTPDPRDFDVGGKSRIVFLATFSIPTRERKIRDRREEGKKLELEFELRLLN